MRRKIANSEGFTLTELMIATTIFSTILLLITFGLLSIGQNYYKGRNLARTQDIARRVLDEVSQAIQYGEDPPGPIADFDKYGDAPERVLGEGVLEVDSEFEFPDGVTADTARHDFEDFNPTKVTIEDYFCIGKTRYVFGNKRVRPPDSERPNAQHGFVTDQGCGVDPLSGAGLGNSAELAPGRRELLAQNTRLTDFKILKNANNYTIIVQVTTGEDEFINLKKPTDASDQPYGTCKPGSTSRFCAVSRLETTVQRRRDN